MGNSLEHFLYIIWAVILIGFGILQLVIGCLGIAAVYGGGWAVATFFSAVAFRFTVPIVIGCYLYAHNIWGWHWIFSAIFAAPGILFMIPQFLNALFFGIRR